ncbi:MAG: M20/M25/M40 family metallo-hydrolase [Verrucomicrobia bacterium]|jgi:Iap family predicted aminopeptidase|nr:M20/M25/M40 family metallo-hydrolase [Verrucomicrobiota bacterium]MBT7068054.1 M20/M25/M40 family metallo-hydrolase [Verrucomicrobiota bacterium]MBT7701767.1 M20/M25/M40 family metallo-hydrolase [Verrucomicrobiota bacterium]
MQTKNPFLAIDRRILADSGTSNASGRNLFALCDGIGPRFAGTDGYRRAAEYMLDQFKAYKLDDAHLEPFAFTAWRRGAPATLVMQDPHVREIACYALPYSAATPPAGVTAVLLDLGPGSRADIEAQRKRIKGRFVMSTCTGVHRTETYAHCAALGAAGFIFSMSMEGMLLGTGSVSSGHDGTIPAVSIGHESALQLQRQLKDGTVRLTLAEHAVLEESTTWNVVGDLRGTEHPDELVIMGGHLDSHEIGPGAFDNGAGAVQVMEVARLLARQRKHLKRTVRFIGFAGEEIGLLGSHYHAKAHAAEMRKARFMLNSDTPSLGRPRGLGFHKCPKGAPYLERLGKQMDTEIVCQNRAHCHSDHYPFILQGVPTAGVGGGRFSAPIQHYYHMAADTPEKVSLTDLRDSAAFSARILLRAASDETWPRMRRSAAEVKEWKAMGALPAPLGR